jgi:2-dehydro-3-deoxyphosphogluconate aldolase/(4S)-4-hydroxy-2-oxoglutarate aldolase
MRSKTQVIDYLLEHQIIAVVRAKSRDQVIPLAEALVLGGVRIIEITTSTPDAISAIERAVRHFGDRALIGVGTILDAGTCSAALKAGAEFAVSPVCRPAFVPLAHQHDRPIMLGAYSPTEAQNAFEAGADFIKIFPAETLGPAYIRALHAPMPHLRIVPTGGIDVANVGDFLRAGCCAVGLGTSLISKEIMLKEDWGALTQRARQFAEAARQAKTSP